jgi:hypothetical protein
MLSYPFFRIAIWLTVTAVIVDLLPILAWAGERP